MVDPAIALLRIPDSSEVLIKDVKTTELQP